MLNQEVKTYFCMFWLFINNNIVNIIKIEF